MQWYILWLHKINIRCDSRKERVGVRFSLNLIISTRTENVAFINTWPGNQAIMQECKSTRAHTEADSVGIWGTCSVRVFFITLTGDLMLTMAIVSRGGPSITWTSSVWKACEILHTAVALSSSNTMFTMALPKIIVHTRCTTNRTNRVAVALCKWKKNLAHVSVFHTNDNLWFRIQEYLCKATFLSEYTK